MKKLLCILAIFAMAACSSTDEAEDTAAAETTETAAEATTTEEATPAETSEQAESAASSADNDSSGMEFPPITGTEKSSATCTLGGDTRTVKVLNITEGGCGVVYNKFSVDKTIAIAKHDMSFCDKVSENVQSNLSAAGFNCNGGGGGAAAPAEEAPAQEPAQEETSSSDAE